VSQIVIEMIPIQKTQLLENSNSAKADNLSPENTALILSLFKNASAI